MNVTDEMVEAACEAFGSGNLTQHGKDRMRDAIAAALSLPSAADGELPELPKPGFLWPQDTGDIPMWSANQMAAYARAAIAASRPSAADEPETLWLLVATQYGRDAHVTYCCTDDELHKAVRAELFAAEPLNADEEAEVTAVRDELVNEGAWYPEGDPPLYLYRVESPAYRPASARPSAGEGAGDWEATPMVPARFGGEEPAFRMDAYYYGFGATGIKAIDLILSAVACAGKAFHLTEDWTQECAAYHEGLRGDSPVDWIDNAAHDAAELARKASRPAAAAPGDDLAELIAAGKYVADYVLSHSALTYSPVACKEANDRLRAALARFAAAPSGPADARGV